MSIGSIIGGVVGGVIGFFMGGPMGAFYGASLGFTLGMVVDPMTPDMPSLGSPNPSEQVMSTEVGTPIADLVGTAKIPGHLLCFGNERNKAVYQESAGGGKGGGGAPPPQVTGYKYYMSWALGFCACPGDSKISTLYAIYKNNDAEPVWPVFETDEAEEVWEGLICPESGGQETIVLDGIGSMDFYFGTDDQVPNSKVAEIILDSTLNTPYRNMCWAFFDDCFIGDYNRTPTFKFIMKKIPEYSFDNGRSEIQICDANPANAMYYILSNLAGLPTSWFDLDDFEAITNTLYFENRGISVLFDRQQSVLGYLESVNAHVDNIIMYGSDAKFHPKLIRDDYDIESIPTINESVLLDDPSFSRGSWIDTVNEVKVQYSEIINRPELNYIYLTSTMYPIEEIEELESGSAEILSGSLQWRNPSLSDEVESGSASILYGNLEQDFFLVEYTNWPVEELESGSATIQYGILRLDFKLIEYPNWPAEELESGNATILSGSLEDVLIKYTNWEVEELESGSATITGGTLE